MFINGKTYITCKLNAIKKYFKTVDPVENHGIICTLAFILLLKQTVKIWKIFKLTAYLS